MREPQKRKLAAILFADIVGYTALMQTNEPLALSSLKKFKIELESKVVGHQGKIIQFYGDGCLATFDSSVDAVTCAKKLQLAFQSEPKVPVRIGLHAGDVVFRDDNVFGDAVNIASRVESMGISGAVLLSSNVRNQIKNQPEFELVSLGRFEFKNVLEGMTVYALQGDNLAIPKQGEIKGKLKESVKTKSQRKWLWTIPLLLVGTLFGIYQWFQQPKSSEFDKAITKERIAVLPFKNNTNNPDLDILGDMAADWVNQGLMDIGEAEVVSPYTVRVHKESIGILENDSQDRPSFSELTGAQNLITGNFYKEKEELIFKLEIVDALEGKLRFGFDAIRGKEDDKEGLITKLRERIAGYWTAREMVDDRRIKAPNYEAYRLYISKLQLIDPEFNDTRNEIVALDSTFYFPRILFTFNNRTGVQGNNIPHFQFLERHLSNLSKYETGWLNAAKYLHEGKPSLVFKSLNQLRLKYPKDPLLNHETAASAYGELYNPKLAIEIYDELPIDGIPSKNLGQYYNFRIVNYVFCLLSLKQTTKAINFLNEVQPISNTKMFAYWYYLMGVVYTGSQAEEITMVETAYEEMMMAFSDAPLLFFATTLPMLDSKLLSPELNLRLQQDIIRNFNSLTPTDMNRFLWQNPIAYLSKNDQSINLDNLEQLPISLQLTNLFYAGRTFIELDKTEKIPNIIEALQKYTHPNYFITSAYGPATANYMIAHLYTTLGENDKALEHLKKSRALGKHNELYQFEYDRNLAPLYDLPEFQKLLKPIWPELKD